VFSHEEAIKTSGNNEIDLMEFVHYAFSCFIKDTNLCAGFLCRWYNDQNSISLISSEGIPLIPFELSKNESLEAYVKECLRLHPAPHIHSVIKSSLWHNISNLVDSSAWQSRAIFMPIYSRQKEYVIIGFTDDKSQLNITKDLCQNVTDVIIKIDFLLSINELENHIKVVEVYVKEVGHDIASSVQAIISKLRNVHQGYLEGPAALTKIREAEEEIMATYRVADTLGIAIDPNYNIGNGDFF